MSEINYDEIVSNAIDSGWDTYRVENAVEDIIREIASNIVDALDSVPIENDAVAAHRQAIAWHKERLELLGARVD